jgi:chitinase
MTGTLITVQTADDRLRASVAHGLGLGMVLVVLAGCGVHMTASSASESPDTSFRVVGYVRDTGLQITDDQLERLTVVNYAFAIPDQDGSLTDVANPWKLQDVVERAHARGIAVLIAIGGWGWDAEFEALAADVPSRARFVRAVVGMVDEYGLDGVDIDWEYPDPGASAQNFLALMAELRAALASEQLLTAAVAAVGPGADGVPAEVYGSIDFLNVMAYDDDGPTHSSMAYAEEALDYWSDRGLAPEKTALGVPFYARPSEASYRELVEADPRAALGDAIDYLGTLANYNGPETMRAKTELAMARASGIMIWSVADDTTDDTSLLRAITDAIRGSSSR